MNIYVMVDNEGISGVYSWEQVMKGGDRRNEGREYMTADINAVIDGLKSAGVDKIMVRDCHGRADTVIWDQLSSCAEGYVVGATGENRMVDIDEYDGVILLGYHAMAGTAGAILDHTWSSGTIQNLWINGRRSGEIAIDAGIAADYGKPVIMVSGDDKLCAEAREFFPWVVTAEVKKGVTSTGGVLLPREKAHDLLREKAAEAVKKFDSMKVYDLERPVTFRYELTERNYAPLKSQKPYMKVIDARTYEVTGDTVRETLYRA